MRKLSILLVLSCTVILSAFSQQIPSSTSIKTAIDPRLSVAFDAAYIEESRLNDPFSLERWTFYLDNAYFISDSPLTKEGVNEDFPSVSIPDIKNINIIKLEREQHLIREYQRETIYKITGTNQYLVYYAGIDFIEKFNAYRREKQTH